MTVISGFDERVILTRRATVWIPHLGKPARRERGVVLVGEEGTLALTRWGDLLVCVDVTPDRDGDCRGPALERDGPRLHRAAFVWRRRERARAPPLASAPRPRRVGSTAGDETSSAPLRLHPPPATPLPPRVEHVILGPDTSGPAASVLARLIPGEPRVDETTVRQLIAFGAVYHAETPPPRVLNGYPRHLRPRRVRDPDLLLTPGAYCRVHVHPKRFPAAAAVDWRARLIASSEDFVAVDKPPGVNVSMTVDNAVECVAQCVAAEMRADNPRRPSLTPPPHRTRSRPRGPSPIPRGDPSSGRRHQRRARPRAHGRLRTAVQRCPARQTRAQIVRVPHPRARSHGSDGTLDRGETSEGPRLHTARELLLGDATWSPSADADADADERARFCTRTDENDACFECSGANRSTRARCRRRFWRRLGIRSRVLSPAPPAYRSRGWSS